MKNLSRRILLTIFIAMFLYSPFALGASKKVEETKEGILNKNDGKFSYGISSELGLATVSRPFLLNFRETLFGGGYGEYAINKYLGINISMDIGRSGGSAYLKEAYFQVLKASLER